MVMVTKKVFGLVKIHVTENNIWVYLQYGGEQYVYTLKQFWKNNYSFLNKKDSLLIRLFILFIKNELMVKFKNRILLVLIYGYRPGLFSLLKSLVKGFRVLACVDMTTYPHNGCKLAKQKRLKKMSRRVFRMSKSRHKKFSLNIND